MNNYNHEVNINDTKLDLEQVKKDIETIRRFKELCDRSEIQNVTLVKAKQECEAIEKDIMHFIEFDVPTDVPYEQRLKEVKQKRREIKNTLQIYYSMKTWSKMFGVGKRNLNFVLEEMQREVDAVNNSVYYPRAGFQASNRRIEHYKKDRTMNRNNFRKHIY